MARVSDSARELYRAEMNATATADDLVVRWRHLEHAHIVSSRIRGCIRAITPRCSTCAAPARPPRGTRTGAAVDRCGPRIEIRASMLAMVTRPHREHPYRRRHSVLDQRRHRHLAKAT